MVYCVGLRNFMHGAAVNLRLSIARLLFRRLNKKECMCNMNKLTSLFLVVMSSFAMLVISSNVSAAKIEFWDARDEQSTQQVDHSKWQEILDIYLNDEHESGINRFDYASVSSDDSAKLDDYLDYLQSLSPRQLNAKEQFAYWVNLYNAKTVDYIIDGVQNDDIESIKEIRSNFVIPGPWKRKDLKVEGKKLSLDNVEHGILRPIWNDRRIHYAVNCASIGCPNLSKTAFTSDNTEEQLEVAEEQFLSHSRAVQIVDGKLQLSSLFDWYGADFASNQSDFFDYIVDFVSLEVEEFIESDPKVSYYYDWNLNAD